MDRDEAGRRTRSDDGAPREDVDSGSVIRYVDGYAVFAEVAEGVHLDDFRMCADVHDGGFTLNLIELVFPASVPRDERCFVKAAAAVEMTNTFMPLA